MFPPMAPLNVREAVPEDAAAIAAVHVGSWRETYKGLIPDDILERLDEAARAVYWARVLEESRRTACVFVAEDGAGVCGFSCGGPERTRRPDVSSELYAIYLMRRAQNKGVGLRLFEAVTSELRTHGHHSMAVWVLDGNPTVGFYEAMGGRLTGSRDEPFGHVVLHELDYRFGL